MTAPRKRPKCPCRKRWYPDSVGAMMALADIARKDRPQAREQRFYPCPHTKGYHLTSQAER